MSDKLCPIRSVLPHATSHNCLRDLCEWYINKECAVVTILKLANEAFKKDEEVEAIPNEKPTP